MTALAPDLIRKIMPRCPAARLGPCAAALAAAADRFDISSPRRVAAFLAQVAHETAELTRVRENLDYRTASRLLAVFPSRFGHGKGATAAERAAGALLAASLTGKPRELAEHVYGGRMGNGPQGCGDGWAFRGAWMLGLTFRANYARIGATLGIALDAHPELIESPDVGALTAAAFWAEIGGNALADLGRFSSISRRIGAAGREERKIYWQRARAALGLG